MFNGSLLGNWWITVHNKYYELCIYTLRLLIKYVKCSTHMKDTSQIYDYIVNGETNSGYLHGKALCNTLINWYVNVILSYVEEIFFDACQPQI